MTSETQDQRFAPPQARVEDVETAGEGLQLASRWSRLGAGLIDMVIGLALLWLASKLTPWNPWVVAGDSYWTPQWSSLGGLALFVAVHGWLLHTKGQTVGKALLRIRIARPDGSAASLGRILGLRYGVGWLLTIVPAIGQIWGFIDALLIFRQSRRCLHDSIADTVVLKA